jgi:DNA repair exonuclease SbcCD nuclease subunit
MVKILITADIHHGIPGKLQHCLWSMELIHQYARKHNINTIIVLGDLFHDRVNLNIEVINLVYDQLKKSVADKQRWICFPGNHDLFLKNSWNINSLHILNSVIEIIEDIQTLTLDNQCFHILPFIYYESKYMETLNQINFAAKSEDILLTHIGVNGATFNECFLLRNWSIINFTQVKFARVYTGHFHCYQQVGSNVWYPGSPIPFKFEEGITEHGFLVYDTKLRTHEFIKTFEIYKEFFEQHPPDYITIIDQDLPKYAHMIPNNRIRLILSHEYTHQQLTNIRQVLKSRGATSVDWSMPKKESVEITDAHSKIDMRNPDVLLNSWLEIDKPDLDQELLIQINRQIVQEAEERIVVEEDHE